ncbi:hypothetical protein [Yeosuana sp.]|uniref:hypothetical protein n=1 Tax=Yeosuana sp. TaxID=2529388 RepID=UPI00405505F4
MEANKANDLIVQEPLYKKVEISKMTHSEAIEILFYKGYVDCFCPYCEKPSVFSGKLTIEQEQRKINLQISLSGSPGGNRTRKLFEKPEIYQLEFFCSRNENHILNVVYKVENETIVKIGQSPSSFELQRGEFKKYKTILGNSYNDLYNAIMFYSSRSGVAAFAHLRRIIENYFIAKAYKECKELPDWNDIKYKEAKFVKKLDFLKVKLPETLTQNPRLYSIISKGIHELEEEECLLYFEALKECIFLSLDDTIEENRRGKSKKKIKSELSRIDNKINKK